MDLSVCTHENARAAMEAGDFALAMRITGPMIEANPADLTAWRLCALAAAAAGDGVGAQKNLKSCALAHAQRGNPLFAVAGLKEIEALFGEAPGDLTEKIANLYGAGSPRLAETEIAPPPLPSERKVRPWDQKLGADEVARRAKEIMAVAWGAALSSDDEEAPLPFVPLLSSLAPRDLAELLGKLERIAVAPDAVVVEQGSEGDAMYVVAEGSVAVRHKPVRGEPVELARLGPGAFFGEMALVSSAPRAAEVRSVERAVLLRARKGEMDALAARLPTVGDVLVAFCHARMLENLVRVSPVLAPVPPAKRPDVIARFETDFKDAGETVIEQGREGRGLYLVVSGAVRVIAEDGGEGVLLATLGPGDLFGEISLLMRKPATASVVAAGPTALLFLPRTEFEAAIADYPELLKGAFDIAVSRENTNNSIMGKAAVDAGDLILV